MDGTDVSAHKTVRFLDGTAEPGMRRDEPVPLQDYPAPGIVSRVRAEPGTLCLDLLARQAFLSFRPDAGNGRRQDTAEAAHQVGFRPIHLEFLHEAARLFHSAPSEE